jgi:hypothetical protein
VSDSHTDDTAKEEGQSDFFPYTLAVRIFLLIEVPERKE